MKPLRLKKRPDEKSPGRLPTASGTFRRSAGDVRHRRLSTEYEVSAGYCDDATQTCTGGKSSVTAMKGSTEEGQFHKWFHK